MSSLIDAMDIGRIQLRARRVCSQGAPGLEISWHVDDQHAIEARTRESMRLWAAYPEAARGGAPDGMARWWTSPRSPTVSASRT
jgi:predicted ATPase